MNHNSTIYGYQATITYKRVGTQAYKKRPIPASGICSAYHYILLDIFERVCHWDLTDPPHDDKVHSEVA